MSSSTDSDRRTGDGRTAAVRGFVITLTALLTTLVLAWWSEWGTSWAPAPVRGRLDDVGLLWPQGWGFFTGLADAEVIHVYDMRPDGELRVVSLRAHWWARLWGLDRSGDTLSDEIWRVTTRIPQDYWRTCDTAAPSECIRLGSPRSDNLPNLVSEPFLCGPKVIVVAQRAGSMGFDSPDRSPPVYRFALVNLTCAG